MIAAFAQGRHGIATANLAARRSWMARTSRAMTMQKDQYASAVPSLRISVAAA
jgi:hypothetical protein